MDTPRAVVPVTEFAVLFKMILEKKTKKKVKNRRFLQREGETLIEEREKDFVVDTRTTSLYTQD